MKKSMRNFMLACVTTLAINTVQAQSIPFPQPSPAATVSQSFATSKIELSYARPSARGRKVFGDVVRYNEFWRTGANAATTLTFGEEVNINGTTLPAGKYGLITFPGENEWTVVLSSDVNVTSEDAYKKENDKARFTVKPAKLNDMVETFTIDFANMKNNSCDIQLKWENTLVSFTVKANYDERIMKQIESTMSKDSRPYYGAANYYYENGKDMGKALEWINKATESNPKAYWVFLLKAKIQKAAKDYNGAMATANHTHQLAKDANDNTYMGHSSKLIAEIEAMPEYKAAPAKKKK
jgi:hypothetical protein